MNKKLLIISEYFPPYDEGGGEISTFLSATHLSEQLSTTVITGQFAKTHWNLKKIHVVPLLFNPKIRQYNSILSKIFFFVLFPYLNAYKVLKYARLYKPTIINIVPHSMYSIPQVTLLILFKFPVIIDVRSFVLTRYYIPDHKNTSAWIFRTFDKIFFTIHKIILELVISLNKNTVIISLSDFIKRELQSHGFTKTRIEVAHNVALPISSGLYTQRENAIAFAGRLESEKGIWDVIYAYERIQNLNITLYIAGQGSEFVPLQNYILNHKLKKIILLGKLSNLEVINLYSKCKAIVAPSRWPEPFGRFIQESVTSLTPIIATNIGGIPEGVINDYNGILVKQRNPQELSKAIEKIVTNDQYFRKLQKNIYSQKDKYAANTLVIQRLKIYNSVIDEC